MPKETRKRNPVLKVLGLWPYLIVILFLIVLIRRLTGSLLPFFGYGLFTVQTGSMNPAFGSGDILIVKGEDPGALKEGDILTYRASSGSIVTHRIREVINDKQAGLYFITRGDANNADDPPVMADRAVGKVVYWLKGVGPLADPSRLLIGTAALLLIGVLIYLLIKTILSKPVEQDESCRNEKAETKPDELKEPNAEENMGNVNPREADPK
ncbi:MAG: signal peptidase I [Oscillospiraceae bacterium]|jgi:signal peptidase|nr:signal peptidase I [Oscillospiraceae bacterium]